MPKPRVMIVEDDIIIAESTRVLLEELGYEVSSIESAGADAVKKACLDRQDAIIMDVSLSGGMDGVEAASKIRSYSKTPIIFITGYKDKSLMGFLKEQSYFYLSKPFATEELKAVIGKALSSGTNAGSLKKKGQPK